MLEMSICVFDLRLKGKKRQGTIIGILFLGLSVYVYMANVKDLVVSFALGLMACTAMILLAVGFEDRCGKTMGFLAKYTMPIFLMHTLGAETLRSVLLKIGITNVVVHVMLGLEISFAGPIMIACIMKKTKRLEFFCIRRSFWKG